MNFPLAKSLLNPKLFRATVLIVVLFAFWLTLKVSFTYWPEKAPKNRCGVSDEQLNVSTAE